MSGLDTLIRNGRRQIEASRRLVVGLLALRASLAGDIGRLAGDADGSMEALAERRQRLERSIAEVDAQIAQARAVIAETVAALERHQLAALRRARRQAPAGGR